jgi:hypothetical protein
MAQFLSGYNFICRPFQAGMYINIGREEKVGCKQSCLRSVSAMKLKAFVRIAIPHYPVVDNRWQNDR